MARQSGLIWLAGQVREYFSETGVTANVVVGWRERGKHINQGPGQANRVVFTPGVDAGNGGRLIGTRSVRENPRAVATWAKLVTVGVWAVDRARANDEEAQIQATEDLFESTVAALREVGRADLDTQDVPVQWTPFVERSFGKELVFQIVQEGPLYGFEYAIVNPGLVLTRSENR